MRASVRVLASVIDAPFPFSGGGPVSLNRPEPPEILAQPERPERRPWRRQQRPRKLERIVARGLEWQRLRRGV